MILVTGAAGLLGRALVAELGARALGRTRAELDITDGVAVARVLDEARPRAVLNAAAYTAVDAAESQPERARAANHDGPAALAAACAARGIPLVHVSTDYVFDGGKRMPYVEEDPPAPLGVYGATKAAGEAAVVAAGGLVVRTSWIFGAGGGSFFGTVLRLARERPRMEIVADQLSCPTYAPDLAAALVRVVELGLPPGHLHLCGSPPTTRHGFATLVVEEAARAGVAPRVPVLPVPAERFPAAAQRPSMSVLDTTRARALGIVPTPWLDGVRAVLGSS